MAYRNEMQLVCVSPKEEFSLRAGLESDAKGSPIHTHTPFRFLRPPLSLSIAHVSIPSHFASSPRSLTLCTRTFFSHNHPHVPRVNVERDLG